MSEEQHQKPTTPASLMSLHDWFAGQALQGLCAGLPECESERLAVYAYEQADVMMSTRRKRQSEQGG